MGEKIIFKNPQGLKLVGIIDQSSADKMIIMAHGFTGDKDERGRFIKAAEAFKKPGYSVLRFDFAGSGESDACGVTLEGQVGDLKAAIQFAKRNGYKEIVLFGHSLGGLCALLSYEPPIKTMVLTAPVTTGGVPDSLKDPVLQKEIKERGFVIIKRSREFRLEKKYLEERIAVNQKEMLSRVKCPVLIIMGDLDKNVRVEDSKRAIGFLPKESKLELLRGADHNLNAQYDIVISLTLDWLKKIGG